MPDKNEFVGGLQDPDTDYCELETSLRDFIEFENGYEPDYLKEVEGYVVYSNCPITDEMVSGAIQKGS